MRCFYDSQPVFCLTLNSFEHTISRWPRPHTAILRASTHRLPRTSGATVDAYRASGATVDTYRTPGATANAYRTSWPRVDAYRTSGATVDAYRNPGATVDAYRTPGACKISLCSGQRSMSSWLCHWGAVSGPGPAAVHHLWCGPGEGHCPGNLKGQKNLPLRVLEVELEPDPHVNVT